MAQLFYPNGTAADGAHHLSVRPETADWDYSGLRVLTVAPDAPVELATGGDELAVLPLSGGCTVEVEHHRFDLAGRPGVFEGVTDFAYLPIDTEVRLTAAAGPTELALCTARATRRIDPYRVAARDVGVEIRGGGFGTRQINNFLSADVHDADKLIAVEVLTPEGNWSSYPPHKHDEFSEHEVALEEIYYFRIHGDKGVGFFNMYSTDGEIALTEVVRDGDLVLVPRGFHGPAAAAPEHHMYYLNVMAGPAEQRVWRFCDDPDHAWIRGKLEEYPPDPRLPLTRAV
jgi:5-deoxy-glucuronate isomerase